MQTTTCHDFSLKHTIDCGQFFYFVEKDDGYVVVERDYVFFVKQEKNRLYFEGVSEEFIRRFFQLDFDLHTLKDEAKDELSLLALEKYWGLRILEQDLWQCLIGFVCSAAANVEKIRMNIRLLSEYFGEEVEFQGEKYYLFPTPGSMNDMEKITKAKTGYRAKFIFEINERLKEDPNLLENISNADFDKAKELLMEFPGIGSKVADCISLFALKNYSAFPVDTWVRQIFEKYYVQKKMTPKQVERVVDDYFTGHLRGVIQQYLFHHERNLK